MNNILFLSHIAPLYREKIFKEIDKEFNVSFRFGILPNNDIKQIDFSVLKNCQVGFKVVKIYNEINYFRWFEKINISDFKYVIITGDIRNLTIWRILLYNRLFKKTKIIFWTHGYYGKEGIGKRMLKRIYYGLSDYLLLYGERAERLLVENNVCKKDKLNIIYNSLNYQEQLSFRNQLLNFHSELLSSHFNNTNSNLIFIGRLTKVKKLDLIIRAMSNLRLRDLKLNLTIIGVGTEYDYLKKLTHELGLNNNVWFYGECYEESVISKLIFEADLCVSPGNVGLTAIHSLMYGTPVITNNDFSHQMPEFESITPGLSGDFFITNDLESLGNTIYNWVRANFDRLEVRHNCFRVIDTKYNPKCQINVLRKVLK